MRDGEELEGSLEEKMREDEERRVAIDCQLELDCMRASSSVLQDKGYDHPQPMFNTQISWAISGRKYKYFFFSFTRREHTLIILFFFK